jgi:hypothetical protein
VSISRAPGASIDTVGVLVPARDEQARIGDCLRALRTALQQVPEEITTAVCLILDRCQDDTEQAALAVLDEQPWPGFEMVPNHRRLTIGAIRDHGMRRLLSTVGPGGHHRMWLLSTDADSVVPPTWIRDHLRHADSGADGVVGTVTLDEPERLEPAALSRYTEILDAGTIGHAHNHAYAANLGVRASAYRAVGGFPPAASGEEHQLLRRLRSAGHCLVTSTQLSVRTSARTRGRTGAGLAELLDALHAQSSSGPRYPMESESRPHVH